MKKPREFEIEIDSCASVAVVELINGSAESIPRDKYYTFHVIEKQAYDELKARADGLAEALEKGTSPFSSVEKENIAKQALKEYRGENE